MHRTLVRTVRLTRLLLDACQCALQDRKRVRTAGRQVLADDGDVQLQDSRSQDYISYEALHRCAHTAHAAAQTCAWTYAFVMVIPQQHAGCGGCFR